MESRKRKRLYKTYFEPHGDLDVPRQTKHNCKKNAKVQYPRSESSSTSGSRTPEPQQLDDVAVSERAGNSEHHLESNSSYSLPESEIDANENEETPPDSDSQSEYPRSESSSSSNSQVSGPQQQDDDLALSEGPDSPLLNDSEVDSSSSDEDGDVQQPFQFEGPPNPDDPIGNETDINCGEALLLILAYVLRHNITGVALEDLLKLINVLFGVEVVPNSKYLFMKLFRCGAHVQCHFFCKICLSYVAREGQDVLEQVNCPQCNQECDISDKKLGNFFLTLPLSNQIQALLEQDKIREKLQERFQGQRAENAVSDIWDSQMYKELCADGGVLSDRNNLSYSFNTDGAPVFSSSGYSMWPVHVTINELPLRERDKNTLLAGIWFGRKTIDMDVFLKPFVEEAEELALHGVTWKLPNGHQNVSHCFPLVCCVDSVARPLLQNFIQFNGRFGCPWCLHPGQQIQRGAGTARVYPLGDNEYQERTERDTLLKMQQALREGRIVDGVKGPSILINLPSSFNIISGVCPDYMHCVLLGVVRQVTYLWLHGAREEYYIGSPRVQATINNRLMAIKPIHEITRLPRPLDTVKNWKATEWKWWLLFYSVPCLKDILPDTYLKHWVLLCESLFLLLQEVVSFDDINKADILLTEFVRRLEVLYGLEACTFNVHQLLHLPRSVLHLGPLWAHSAFGFENGNRVMKNFVKGAKSITLQITKRFMLHRALPMVVQQTRIGESAKTLLDHLVNPYMSIHNEPREGALLLGRPEAIEPSPEEREALIQRRLQPLPLVMSVYKRMVWEGKVYHSSEYGRSSRRDDKTVMTTQEVFGRILKITSYTRNGRNEVVLFVQPFIVSDEPVLTDNRTNARIPHIVQVIRRTEDILAIKLDDILKKCLFLDTRPGYICCLPNYHERD